MSDIFDVPKVLRFHAQPERIFDHSNDTVLVTRTLLTNTADEIDRLRSQVEKLTQEATAYRSCPFCDGSTDHPGGPPGNGQCPVCGGTGEAQDDVRAKR